MFFPIFDSKVEIEVEGQKGGQPKETTREKKKKKNVKKPQKRKC